MRPSTAFTFFIVLGFLLILFAIALRLHIPAVDGKLLASFIGVGMLLMLLAVWLNYKTGIVRIHRRYEQLGAATSLTVLGFLLLLFTFTLHLMEAQIDAQFTLALIVIGLFLMMLGLLIGRGDKEEIRL
ncbi:MAG: hypothetical protein R3202_13040, partial [Candidatus Competibacterales bacterium]|nr:hypothetical protein [Candidatus Competibacterales bacterium]